jgi:hypothetical protein
MAGCCWHGDELLDFMERVKAQAICTVLLRVGKFDGRPGTEGGASIVGVNGIILSTCNVTLYGTLNVKNALVKSVHCITDDQ